MTSQIQHSGSDGMETIEFSTPTNRKRATVQTKVDLVGRTYTVHRPKDGILFFTQSAVADSANDADRWMAALKFIDATFQPQDRKDLIDRCCDSDDALTSGAVWDMISQLLSRWSPENTSSDEAVITVEGHSDTSAGAEPVRITNDDLDLDLVCYPPKDIVLGITASAIAASASPGQQAWCISLFLDGALSRADAMWLSQRLRAPAYTDDLDLEDIASIVQSLLERWYPSGGNRRARRAAAKQRSSGGVSASGDGASPGQDVPLDGFMFSGATGDEDG